MSLDVKQPKGYRKAWNGGKPPADTDASDEFGKHLDMCRQCHDHPWELCVVGADLLKKAVSEGP